MAAPIDQRRAARPDDVDEDDRRRQDAATSQERRDRQPLVGGHGSNPIAAERRVELGEETRRPEPG